ncbi:MAG: Fe-only nitrogenase accessory protein AnfO [Bacillota bacterium]|nr:Fe-only nitrogenase accessory protein AnfO [Bacillota bacterium]
MSKEIAVALDNNGDTSTLYETSVIKVYKKENEQWEAVKEINFEIDNWNDMKLVRQALVSITDKLDSCKIFVGKEISGLPNAILDMAGFTIAEVDGKPEDFLQELLEEVEQYQESKASAANEKPAEVQPVKVNDQGSYRIDLKQVQEQNPGISSKKALIPFLQNTTFYELEITCGHTPPWLEDELKKMNYKLKTIKNSENDYTLIVYRGTCKGC